MTSYCNCAHPCPCPMASCYVGLVVWGNSVLRSPPRILVALCPDNLMLSDRAARAPHWVGNESQGRYCTSL